MKIPIFRWRAIIPLLVLLVVVAILALLFAEPVARSSGEDAATDLLGTEVDIGSLDIRPKERTVTLGRLQVADPFDPLRNLVEAGAIGLRLNVEALAEKKLVVERLSIRNVQFNTRRARAARPAAKNSFARQMVGTVRQWAQQFDVPLLSLTPIDTLKQIALDPTKLATIRQAQAMVGRVDSTQQALQRSFQSLDIRGTLDSARLLADSLTKLNPTKLGLQGTQQTVASVRRTLAQLDSARQRVEALERNARGSLDLLKRGVQSLDAATQQDYAFAKGLLKLPNLAAPEFGKAFFGRVSIERVQQAVYWAELAQKYLPPGLLPQEQPGPRRLRMAGTTVRFPKEHAYPPFLLQSGDVDFTVAGDGPLKGAYRAAVQGLTSAPALYGKPTVIAAQRRAAGSVVAALDVNAVLNHLGPRPRDSVAAFASGVKLPTIQIPGVPFTLAAGTGTSRLNFAFRGDALNARWSISSKTAAWAADSTARPLSELERLVFRVVSGLGALDMTADVSGPLRSPRFTVRSNLDDAIAGRLRAVIGEEVAKAETKVRAKVDSMVQEKAAPIRARADSLRTDAEARIADQKQKLQDTQTRLETELKRLAGPFGGAIPIPKFKL